MNQKRISVVIPCFNEGKTIRQNIQKIHGYLANNFAAFEIIAVDDGSLDNTFSELETIAKELPIKIIRHEKNLGKGKAVRDGVLTSQYEISMFLDADLAIPIESLPTFIEEIKKGFALAIASRFVPGLTILQPVLWYRKIMEKIFRILRMIILNNWTVKDTQCGFKVFETSAAKRIFGMATINRFAFDSEIIFIAKKFGYSIKELPIALQNPPQSSVRIFFDPLNMFFSLFQIRLNDLKGIYPWKKTSETQEKK
jgi:glycosyltransferase involved in cell wall biosynthesis